MKAPFRWDALPRPYFISAPLDGISDSAYRQIMREEGADVTFSEMTAVEGLASKRAEYFPRVTIMESEQPVIVQLFGKDPECFAKAAKRVQDLGAAGVDINMGCPSKTVRKSGHGVALMEKPELAAAVVRAAAGAVDIPVSVKFRLGWDTNTAVEFAQVLEAAGCSAITLHPRLGCNRHEGDPDYDTLRDVVRAVKIPVMGSGGVKDVATARWAIAYTGAAGFMVGRGALGNPWVFRSIKQDADYHPTTLERVEKAKDHVRRLVATKGDHGILEARKHLAWYIKGFADASTLRDKLVRINSEDEALRLLDSAMA